MTAKTDSTCLPSSLPADVADVALISAATCAAIGEMKTSWWLDMVRAGRAPRPAIQQPRCTRWRKADVIRFWDERIAAAAASSEAARARAVAHATKASAAAKAKRNAMQAGA